MGIEMKSEADHLIEGRKVLDKESERANYVAEIKSEDEVGIAF